MQPGSAKASLWQLFAGFAKAGITSFGGAMPLVKHLVVEQEKWLPSNEFASLVGLCQFIPGPNATNVSMCVGMKLRGAVGAAVAAVGLLSGPVALACSAAAAFDAYGDLPLVQAAAQGAAAAGAGLLLATGIKLGQAIEEKAIWLPVSGAALLAVGGFRLPALPVLVGLLVVTGAMAWHRLEKVVAK